MTFERLKGFAHIAWDFDDTLVNHPASEAIWTFIRENPYDQKHSIITMRSHGMQDEILDILYVLDTGLDEGTFVHILNVPDALWSSHRMAEIKREPLLDHPYRMWKGERCVEIGAEVLVDDMEEDNVSARGCEVHNVVHVHPDELLQTEVTRRPE